MFDDSDSTCSSDPELCDNFKPCLNKVCIYK